jgi:uncharacterized protein
VTQIRFEWDETKNLSNQRKHGIAFEAAALVFRDPFCVFVQDRIEDGEERWQTIGLVEGVLLLLVAHTVQQQDGPEELIRILSARRATAKERRRYEDEND